MLYLRLTDLENQDALIIRALTCDWSKDIHNVQFHCIHFKCIIMALGMDRQTDTHARTHAHTHTTQHTRVIDKVSYVVVGIQLFLSACCVIS